VGIEEAWRQRILQKIEWIQPIDGRVVAAAEALMSDEALLPKSGFFARLDAQRQYVCLTEESLYLLQMPSFRLGHGWWMLKKPLIRIPRSAVVLEEEMRDASGRIALRLSWPGQRATYLTFGPAWREQVGHLSAALQTHREE